jgi:hypothetical protein
MKPKFYLALDLTFILFVIILLCAFTSCTYQKKIVIKEPDGQGIIIVLNNTNQNSTVIVLETNKTLNISQEPKPEQPSQQAQEQKQEEAPEQTTEQVPSVPARVSEVEFYFLLTGKSYFKATQKENQAKTYNLSGELITINPIFISQDEVKFQINDYTTKALAEKEWGTTPEFEVFVNAIYYRP